MDCLSETRLRRVKESAPSGDPADLAHLHNCPTCRTRLAELQRDDRGAPTISMPAVSGSTEPLGSLPELSGLTIGPTSLEPEPLPEIPGYQIVREIHRGGQGVVYEALQESTNRTVALKMILEETSAGERARRRFEREVRLIAQLKHPHIVVIHDSGITQGRYFFAMDYIAGRTLDEFVRQGGLSLRETIRLFAQVCDAVSYAHGRLIIHRDLKPSNILVDEGGQARILDFGLATVLGDQPAFHHGVTVSG